MKVSTGKKVLVENEGIPEEPIWGGQRCEILSQRGTEGKGKNIKEMSRTEKISRGTPITPLQPRRASVGVYLNTRPSGKTGKSTSFEVRLSGECIKKIQKAQGHEIY